MDHLYHNIPFSPLSRSQSFSASTLLFPVVVSTASDLSCTRQWPLRLSFYLSISPLSLPSSLNPAAQPPSPSLSPPSTTTSCRVTQIKRRFDDILFFLVGQIYDRTTHIDRGDLPCLFLFCFDLKFEAFCISPFSIDDGGGDGVRMGMGWTYLAQIWFGFDDGAKYREHRHRLEEENREGEWECKTESALREIREWEWEGEGGWRGLLHRPGVRWLWRSRCRKTVSTTVCHWWVSEKEKWKLIRCRQSMIKSGVTNPKSRQWR